MTAWTIVSAVEAFRSGDRTPDDVLEECLDRIDAWEPHVHAWAALDIEGAREAATASTERWRNNEPLGPLDGIPIGVKDIFDVRGMPTRCGAVWRSDLPAMHDAAVVSRLRNRGAIILGKTVTAEFACFDPPPTRNPWRLAHTAGGSSSGSAAAVAAGMCLAAIGSQTGGSTIRPAAYCGVVGFKSTFAAVAREGMFPVSQHLDHVGFFTRCARDAQTLLEVALDRPANPAEGAAPGVDIDYRPRVGALGGFFRDHASPDVLAVYDAAMARVAYESATVRDVQRGADFAQLGRQQRTIMAVEAAEVHRETYKQHRNQYGPCLASLIVEGQATSPADYQAALLAQKHARRDAVSWFKDIDCLAMPATNITAPDPSTTGDPLFNAPWSIIGLPAITLPCGLATTGLPVGLQLIGRRNDDYWLLRMAGECERALTPVPLPTLPE